MWVMFVVPDRVQENAHVSVITVGQGVAVGVRVAAGAAAVDVVTAAADQQRQTSRRRVVLAVADKPEKVGLEAEISQREVDHALTARPSVAVQAVARNLMIRTKGVARTVVADQKRAGQRAVKRRRRADQEAMMTVRTVVLQARNMLPEVVLSVMRRHAKVDQEVLKALRKAGPAVAASQNKKMAETVAVVRLVLVRRAINVKVIRLVETKSQTEMKTLRLREVVAEVVQLVAKLIASLQLVTWMIRSMLLNRMRTGKSHELVADHQAMTRTGISTIRMIRKVQHVIAKVTVGRPVRKKRRVIVVLSQEAQGKLEVEAVQAVVARTGADVVQEIAARPEALRQAQVETRREVVAIQPSVPSALQRTGIVVVLAAVEKTEVRLVARMVAVSYKARKGRKHEAVHRKIPRAVRKLAEATHAVLHVHAAGPRLPASLTQRLLVKATRNRAANPPTKSELCIL